MSSAKVILKRSPRFYINQEIFNNQIYVTGLLFSTCYILYIFEEIHTLMLSMSVFRMEI